MDLLDPFDDELLRGIHDARIVTVLEGRAERTSGDGEGQVAGEALNNTQIVAQIDR